MMISCVINIIGDVLLVGFFDMAASGAAIATVFAQLISVLSSFMFLVPGALMAGISAFTAQNIGAGLYKRAKQALFIGMGCSVIAGLVMFYEKRARKGSLVES